jgi:hypothetical protein
VLLLVSVRTTFRTNNCVAVLHALAAVGDLSTWAREHHAKLVYAFVMRTQASALALVPLVHDAEAIGFAWSRRAALFRRRRLAHTRTRTHAREGCRCQRLG